MNFDFLCCLPDFDERPYVDVVSVKLNDVVGAVHVQPDLVALKLHIPVLGSVIGERSFAAAEVAPEYEETVTGLWLHVQGVQEAAIDRGLAADLVCRV